MATGRRPRSTAVSGALRAIAAGDAGGEPLRIEADGLYFGPNLQYRLTVAAESGPRIRAWELAQCVYEEKGYAAPGGRRWYGLHDALPETLTLLAERRGEAVGALTVVYDSALKLPADELFGVQLDALRSQDRRPAELVSLVCAEKDVRAGSELVKRLFKLAWLHAQGQADDFIITVNPRHEAFYRRALLFERFGEDRPYPKVQGAPATPLRLDLRLAETRYRNRYAGRVGASNLYRFFVNGEESCVRDWLKTRARAMPASEVERLFVHERSLLPAGVSAHQDLVQALFGAAVAMG